MKNLACLTALLLVFGTTALAQPGNLDGNFGTGGLVTTVFASGTAIGNSVAVQPDGKILVAGYAQSGSIYEFALARYNPDGSLDNSFGTDGMATTDIGSSIDRGESVALLPDGKFIVAGSAYNGLDEDLALARYNADGSLDNSFGTDGKVITNLGTSDDIGKSVAVQPDGKIVVTVKPLLGSTDDLTLLRYNVDGTLDNSFGTDGVVTTDFGSSEEEGESVAIQPDGKIVVAGTRDDGPAMDFAVVRYNTDGSLDNSFGTDGKVTTDFGSSNNAGRAIAVQQDGKVVVAGISYNGSDWDFAVARYNADGSPDNSFSSDGKVSHGIGLDDDYTSSVSIQPDGKIVVTGSSKNLGYFDFALTRYNADGSLDNSFGADGKVTTDFGSNTEYGNSGTLQPDGKIVVAGHSHFGGNTVIALARYISGLDIGVVEFSSSNNVPLIYPNPIRGQATLEYSLAQAETISIRLLDMQGKTLQVFTEGRKQAAGDHRQTIELPEALPSGSYLIAISSQSGKCIVQVEK